MCWVTLRNLVFLLSKQKIRFTMTFAISSLLSRKMQSPISWKGAAGPWEAGRVLLTCSLLSRTRHFGSVTGDALSFMWPYQGWDTEDISWRRKGFHRKFKMFIILGPLDYLWSLKRTARSVKNIQFLWLIQKDWLTFSWARMSLGWVGVYSNYSVTLSCFSTFNGPNSSHSLSSPTSSVS